MFRPKPANVGQKQKRKATPSSHGRRLGGPGSFCELHLDRGGFSVALSESGHECCGFSEIDPHATRVYQSHFPSHHNYGDITTIAAESLPDFDLLCGGFPCQAFSVARRRMGFADTRGTLFFDLCRILHAKSPRLFVFENVKGLLSHDEGRTFKTVVTALDELGYDLQWQVLNSKYFGVPPNRERVFIVGSLGGTPRPEVFPVGCCLRGDSAAQAESCGEGRRVRCDDAHVGGVNGIAATLAARDYKGGWNILCLPDGRMRRLTPVECERLRGYPDGYTAAVSDTPWSKGLGNLVVVNVVREIVRRL